MNLWGSSAVWVAVAVISIADAGWAQQRSVVGRSPRVDVPAAANLADIPPLSEARLRGALRDANADDQFSFGESAISLSVERPFDTESRASLGFLSPAYVTPLLDRAWIASGSGLAEIYLPRNSGGSYVIDCTVYDVDVLHWRGRQDGEGTVSVIDGHAIFIAPGLPSNTIEIRPVEPRSWGIQGCRFQRLQ